MRPDSSAETDTRTPVPPATPPAPSAVSPASPIASPPPPAASPAPPEQPERSEQPEQRAEQPEQPEERPEPEQRAESEREPEPEQRAEPEPRDEPEQAEAEEARDQPLEEAQDQPLEEAQERPAEEQVAELKPGEAEPLAATAAALWQQSEIDGYRERWRQVQVAFLDDPRAAAEQAERLLADVLESLTEVLAGHKRQLDDWRSADRRDTEELRATVLGYRDLLDRVLGF